VPLIFFSGKIEKVKIIENKRFATVHLRISTTFIYVLAKERKMGRALNQGSVWFSS
jgi:hypothetical protein